MIHRTEGNRRIESVIGELAARQHGVVARSQLLEAGVPRHRIDYRLECGSLTPLHRGVYSAAPLPGRLQREFAGVLAVGDGSFVSTARPPPCTSWFRPSP